MQRLVAIAVMSVLVACGGAKPGVALHDADSPPALLSEWGVLMSNGRQLSLNEGVIPYELNTPLFSDYALKLRTVWLPDGKMAQYDDVEEFDFPVGTIISKTFHYEKAGNWSWQAFRVVKADREATPGGDGHLDLDANVLLETRLLVRYADGWRAFPYVWNAAQTDAMLEIAGELRELQLQDSAGSETISYVIPDANQCAGCHTPDHSAGDLRPLGPKAWQLNRDGQLQRWVRMAMLAPFSGTPPAGARWSDPATASPEQRVRDYLDANCAHCHNPAGAADTSALHLGRDAPLDRHYGVCKTPVAVGRGSGDRPYDIYPGRADESILVYRMENADPAIAMPELGRSAIHAEGVAALRQWIDGMPGEC